MKVITSKTNHLIKKIVALQSKKHRDQENLIWVEGLKCVQTLLESKYIVEQILVNVDAQDVVYDFAESLDLDVYYAEEDCFNKCSSLKNPEGIGAIVQAPRFDEIPANLPATTVVLWQIGNPGNLGCLIRTATGLGVNSIVIVEPAVDVFNPMAIRSSTGALFFSDIYRTDEPTIMEWLKKHKKEVVALTGDGKNLLPKLQELPPKILVIGNEPHGLPASIREDFTGMRLPMKNNIESLNVSTAAAIAIYNLWSK